MPFEFLHVPLEDMTGLSLPLSISSWLSGSVGLGQSSEASKVTTGTVLATEASSSSPLTFSSRDREGGLSSSESRTMSRLGVGVENTMLGNTGLRLVPRVRLISEEGG